MITTKITIKGCEFYIVPAGFEFVSQTHVKFYGFRLSKKQLITCCEFFIHYLRVFGYSDRLKCGFNLKCFKYYELSVYLHGLISLYCSHLKNDVPPCFGITIFSHLPHDVMLPEKESNVIEVAFVNDLFCGSVYCCVVSGCPLCSSSLDSLKSIIYQRFPNIRKKYNIILDVK